MFRASSSVQDSTKSTGEIDTRAKPFTFQLLIKIHNQKHSVQSLAIPETSLLFLAQYHLGLLKMSTKTVNKGDRYQPDSKCILRGILPSLQYVIHQHRMTEMASMSSQGSKHKKVSIDPKPNTHQNQGKSCLWFDFITIWSFFLHLSLNLFDLNVQILSLWTPTEAVISYASFAQMNCPISTCTVMVANDF